MIKGMSYDEYQRKYQREYRREQAGDPKIFRLKASDAMKLRMWYEEYTMKQQQDLGPVVSFHDFVIHFFELGYTSWRSRNKDK